MWKRRKWLAILVFIEVITVVVSVTLFLPGIYQSTATILVERHQVPEAFVQSTIATGIDFRLRAITQEVLSRSRLESLIDRFNLYPDLRQRVPLEQVIERMRRDILLEPKGQESQGKGETTVAFTISYKGSNPEQVAQVANTLASFYIDENLKVREQQAIGTADFLRAQLDEMQRRQEEQEQRLRQFQERYMGELPGQLQANLKVLETLHAHLRLNSEQRTRNNEQRTALAQQLAELEGLIPPTSRTTVAPATGPKPDANVAQLEKLQQELVALRTRGYTEKYPSIVQLQSVIAALEQQFAETDRTKKQDSTKKQNQAKESPLNPYVQQLKKELDTLDAEIKAQHAEEQDVLHSIALYQQRVENAPQRDQELQVLQRDYDTAKEFYQSLLKRQEEAQLAEHLEQRQKGEQFRLIEPALPTKRPKEPDRRKRILIGLFGALGLAAGTVILAEQLHPSFHTVDELSAFSQVPVLVSLPYIATRADILRRRWWFGLVALSAILSLGFIVGSSYVAIKGQVPLAELYAQLQHLRK
jgi:polysaccharide chain length determinant protein (PEP-CTERM system associated)